MHNKICDLRESLYWISSNARASIEYKKTDIIMFLFFYGIYKLYDKIDEIEQWIQLRRMCKHNLCDKMRKMSFEQV